MSLDVFRTSCFSVCHEHILNKLDSEHANKCAVLGHLIRLFR